MRAERWKPKKKIQFVVLATALLCIAAGYNPIDNAKLTNVFNQNPKDVWISATRTDGKGAGTQIDPIDGSTLVKMNTAIAALASGSTVHLTSDVTFSGTISLSVANLTFDPNGHKIVPASVTDTAKISIAAAGVTIPYIEIAGAGITTGSTTGSAINSGYPRTRVRAYVHDLMDAGVTHNGDFSDCHYDVTADNTLLSGVYINSQNAAVNGADIGPCRITRTGASGKGLAVARGGAETNPIYGVNIHDIYYDKISGEGSSQEAMYIHGLVDYHISHVTGSNNVWNVSNDLDQNGTISDVVTRGGMRTQYCGMELASCYNMTISNCIFNGYSRTSSTVTMTIASPGVVTWTAHGLTNGQGIVFATTGALPTGITAGALYYVVSSSTNTFQLSATEGGSAINTSGSQSGTHTATLATSEHINVASTTGLVSSNGGPIGKFEINNVRSFGYDNGFWMQSGGGIVNFVGGYFGGWQNGLSFDGVDHVHVTSVTAESLGATGNTNTPISVRAEGSALSDFRLINNFLSASATAESRISLYSSMAGGSLNGVSIIGNTAIDSNSPSNGSVKVLTGSGGSVNDLRMIGNLPAEKWGNEPNGAKLIFTPSATGWYRILSSGCCGLLDGRMLINTAKENFEIKYSIPSFADACSVVETLGGVVHAQTNSVTQVRVGNSSGASLLDLNIGTSGVQTTIFLPDDGYTFSGNSYLVSPPTFSPTAPTQFSTTITLTGNTVPLTSDGSGNAHITLPTSCSGLPSGTLYNNSGTPAICP